MQIQYQGIKVQCMSREGMLNSPESSPTQLVVTHSVDQYKPSGISYNFAHVNKLSYESVSIRTVR
jgi:hypothetical protein